MEWWQHASRQCLGHPLSWITMKLWLIMCTAYMSHYGAVFCTAGQVYKTEGPMQQGHLNRFGEGRPNHPVDSVENWPSSIPDFFERYVKRSRPLKMTGAAKLSPAFHKWTDEYFISLDYEPKEYQVVVESRKKENRSVPSVPMNFQEFVKIYNKTDQYMVHRVPPFIEKDVSLPGPLQCDVIYKHSASILESIMWFSSGGTKSVVHTDAADNIICLYRGTKQFVMVDPHVYGDKVDLDRPEGSFSNIDVDRVDYYKYPGLADVEYYKIHLKAGDCLFIPYLWIHQVRSDGSNVAVNIWWNHHLTLKHDLSSCDSTAFNPQVSFGDVSYTGFDDVMNTKEQVIDQLLAVIRREKRPLDFEMLMRLILGKADIDQLNKEAGTGYQFAFRKAFRVLDGNHDGGVVKDEIMAVSEEGWKVVTSSLEQVQAILNSLDDEEEEEEGQGEMPPHDEL